MSFSAAELATWRRSSYSGGQGNCIELAVGTHSVGLRDSKNPTGPMLIFQPRAVTAFLGAIKGDLLR